MKTMSVGTQNNLQYGLMVAPIAQVESLTGAIFEELYTDDNFGKMFREGLTTNEDDTILAERLAKYANENLI